MKFILTTLFTAFTFSFGFSQCAVCTITNPASLPNPIPAGTIICITTNQIYDGSLNLTGGSIHVCSGASLRINGSVNISSTSSMTVTGCSTIEVNGNIDNNNPSGLMVLDNCNCPAAIDVSGPIFGYQIVCGPLPVELISFNVDLLIDNTVEASWSTSSEVNNDYFIVEQSTDAIQWNKIAEVKGAGNSNEIKKYSTKHEIMETGTYYYRLSQVDFDGKMEVFEMKSIAINSITGNNEIHLYPNPAVDYAIVYMSGFADEELNFEVINLSGQVVYSRLIPPSDSREVRLDLNGLENGIFVLKCYGAGFNQSSKLVISK